MAANFTFLGLIVDDVQKSTQYYVDVLGFKLDEAESVPPFYSQMVNEGGSMFALMGGFGDAPQISQQFDTGFFSEDADQTYAEWEAKGVEMITEPTDMPFGRTFLCRTPDQHVLRVFTPASR